MKESKFVKKCVTAYKVEKSNIKDIQKKLESPEKFLEITASNLTSCTMQALINKKHVLWIEADEDESLELWLSDTCGE